MFGRCKNMFERKLGKIGKNVSMFGRNLNMFERIKTCLREI